MTRYNNPETFEGTRAFYELFIGDKEQAEKMARAKRSGTDSKPTTVQVAPGPTPEGRRMEEGTWEIEPAVPPFAFKNPDDSGAWPKDAEFDSRGFEDPFIE